VATVIARILQSFGLNTNVGLLQNREWGVSSDTEQPAVGTTLGGPKYLGTEENVNITVTSPAALAIRRRSLTMVFVDTATAGGHVNLDIQAGAQIAGYRCRVFVAGSDSYQAIVTYGSGLIEYIPNECSQEFVWSGSAWMKTQLSNADRYLVGSIIDGMIEETASAKNPVVPLWDADHTITQATHPKLYDKLRNQKAKVWDGSAYVDSFTVTIAGAVATGSGTAWDNWLASMLEDEVVQGSYSNWRCATIGGNDYEISNVNTVAHTATFTTSPPSGSQTLYYYPHRIAGTSSSVRTYKDSGRALMSIDGVTLCANNRRRDRFESHYHNVASPFSGILGRRGTGGSFTISTSGGSQDSFSGATVGVPSTDGVDTLRTGSKTEPNSTPIYRHMWAGVQI